MRRRDFDQLIDRGSFAELFITEMGWDNPDNTQPLYITIDGLDYDFMPVAQKQGFHVYSCNVDLIPSAAECKKVDNKLRNYGYDYICIFVMRGSQHHLWLTPVKTNEKRELVKTEYIGGARADFLFSKIDDLSFELTERVYISDVKARVHGSFHLNSEKVTKDFYAQFRKEHTAFKKHITGIDDEKNKDWYTSVMLNRLMFCYFIQKKGFLDMNVNYLQDKLKWVKQQQGEDQFFGTFYKGFLCALFHEGLNNPQHDNDEFCAKYGRIPYLNGGMFDDHQLERENLGIDIADVAFQNLFNFFDKWNWHLDTRLTASGKDINPDVLGYIFEQYINDRAAMGVYYTKEDITEYIGKNCIIPFLMDKTAAATQDAGKAFEPQGWIWQSLQQSGDKYIYDAVKKGYSADWQQLIPAYISEGIDTTTSNLLERRSRWNEKTYENFALPTEIWRETVERLQRCDSLLQKIQGGEIHSINDFITYNLDIRQFVEDLIRTTQDHHFVSHFYHALQGVTILDPTCGSGAFLFAALNILEPLYEACIDRMEDFHQQNAYLFTHELEEINAKYSSNRQYFIYKSIILRNLYGVDIMVEATEIAKLRLFLKMVAVVEVDKRKDNLGLDPLPDIDFNIKCGNTLVGYATEAELSRAIIENSIFAQGEFEPEINRQMLLVSKAYELFRSEQLKVYDDNSSIKETKDHLKKRLDLLNEVLNRFMHSCIAYSSSYESWLSSHQPFHWLAEFYQIIKGNGGFDVIIGNPPYVEYNKRDRQTGRAVSDYYKIEGYKTEACGNLYAFVLERAYNISNSNIVGMIVPTSSIVTPRMLPLQKILLSHGLYHSTYGFRPAKLFDGGTSANIHLSILISTIKDNEVFGLHHIKWNAEYREFLFSTLPCYTTNMRSIISKYKKVARSKSQIEKNILHKIHADKTIESYFGNTEHHVYYRTTGGLHYRAFTMFPTNSKKEAILQFTNTNEAKVIFTLLASNMWNMFYYSFGNCLDVSKYEITQFPIDISSIELSLYKNLSVLAGKLNDDIAANSNTIIRHYENAGDIECYQVNMRASKPIIDEIDKVLAKHYGFTEEELDFIINYDIKYRMGDELDNNE